MKYLQEFYPNKVYGVNMLGFPEMAFDLARKYGAKFVQMDSVCGHLEPSYEKPFLKKLEAMRGNGDIFLLGGVRFKYQPYRSGRSLEEDLKLGTERCDAIVVTGEGTGISTDLEKIKTFRSILGDFPLIVGAGMTAETAAQQLAYADGAIVGTGFKELGITEYPVDEARVVAFMTSVKQSPPNHHFIYETVGSGKENSAKLFGEFVGDYEWLQQYVYSYPAGVVITQYIGNESQVIIPTHIDGMRVVGVGKEAFYQNKEIKTVRFEEGTCRIGEWAFAECDQLCEVDFPISLKMIDESAFYGCPLDIVNLPPCLRKIGHSAFEETKIRELVLPDSLVILGDWAFLDCGELESVKISDGIVDFVDWECGSGWPDDLERYFCGDDSYAYLGAVRTFGGCIRLKKVECRHQKLGHRQLEQMFSETPWWKEFVCKVTADNDIK